MPMPPAPTRGLAGIHAAAGNQAAAVRGRGGLASSSVARGEAQEHQPLPLPGSTPGPGFLPGCCGGFVPPLPTRGPSLCAPAEQTAGPAGGLPHARPCLQAWLAACYL